jgi:hypothetical protein
VKAPAGRSSPSGSRPARGGASAAGVFEPRRGNRQAHAPPRRARRKTVLQRGS